MSKDALLDLNVNMNPIRLEFELTEQCNLSCRFCYNSQCSVVSSKAYEILKKLYDENVLEIVLTGGEPMGHPDFKNIFVRCSGLFSKVLIQTNGTYITPEIAELFRTNNVYGVNISLHGNKIVHEKLTGVADSYDCAVAGMKRLLERDIRLASNFVLTSENVLFLSETIDMLYSIGVKEVTLTRFTPTGSGAKNAYLMITLAQLLAALYMAQEKMNEYSDLKIILANSVPYCALPPDLSFFCSYCHFGSSRFYIDINGNVLLCGMLRIVIGNILIDSFRSIKSRSKEYQSHICGEDVPLKCGNCIDFDICRGGCRAAAYACKKDLSDPDPYMSGE
jgi:radical SAM protein with 4Fe4S-binding SPASM domain